MGHWVGVCGVGPWFYAEQLPLDEFRYKDRPYDLKVSVALANSGDVHLEGGVRNGWKADIHLDRRQPETNRARHSISPRQADRERRG
jgi:hypothetical protein